MCKMKWPPWLQIAFFCVLGILMPRSMEYWAMPSMIWEPLGFLDDTIFVKNELTLVNCWICNFTALYLFCYYYIRDIAKAWSLWRLMPCKLRIYSCFVLCRGVIYSHFYIKPLILRPSSKRFIAAMITIIFPNAFAHKMNIMIALSI